MMYDVVCVREHERWRVQDAVEKVVKRVNDICNNGHNGKKGWRPHGGISIATNEYYVFAAQAIVCYEDDVKNRNGEFELKSIEDDKIRFPVPIKLE